MIGGVHEPACGAHSVELHFREDRLQESGGEAAASVVGADGEHHHVAVFGEGTEGLVLEALVGGDGSDARVEFSDDYAPIEGSVLGVVSPTDQTSDDLGDFVEPSRGLTTKVERTQRRGVRGCEVAKDHGVSREAALGCCLGCQRVLGRVGISATLPPLARLRRRGDSVVASAAEIR